VADEDHCVPSRTIKAKLFDHPKIELTSDAGSVELDREIDLVGIVEGPTTHGVDGQFHDLLAELGDDVVHGG
jgi:hypothetical protein